MARTSKTDTSEIPLTHDSGASLQTPIVREMEDLCRLFVDSVAAQGAIIADQWGRMVELAAFAAEFSHDMLLSPDTSESDMEDVEAFAREMEATDPSELIAQLQAGLRNMSGAPQTASPESNGAAPAPQATAQVTSGDGPIPGGNGPNEALNELYDRTVRALCMSFDNTVTAMQQLNVTGQAMVTMAVTQIFSWVGVAAEHEAPEA